MKKQSSVGVSVMGFGKLLLVTVLVVCVVDIAGLESRGGLLDCLPGFHRNYDWCGNAVCWPRDPQHEIHYRRQVTAPDS